DVPNMYQDGDGSRYVNQLIRDEVKTNDPNDILIGEIWGRANAWLTGTMQDGVQNMPFGEDTIAWLKGGSDALYSDHLLFSQENYPPEAFYSLWTILGNHDTARVLTRLDDDKEAVMLAATLQFTYPGVPMVYYGDEAGLAGASDPNNRGAYPWGSEDTTMQAYYQKLGLIRNTYPVLRTGSFELLPDNVEGIMVYGRELPGEQYPESVVLVNRLEDAVLVSVDASALTGLQYGDILQDVLGSDQEYTVGTSNALSVVIQPNSAQILVFEDLNWVAPTTTTDTTETSDTTDTSDPTDTDDPTIGGFPFPLMLLGILSITSIIGHKLSKNSYQKSTKTWTKLDFTELK
ncbi:MAG: alpha-amylase family glycosyl hydrolase, partial [Promethearchaeota archaeon]